MLVDTHCHIHDDDFELDADEVLKDARSNDVGQLVCVGTDGRSSEQAVVFAERNAGVAATVGLHPHDADREIDMQVIAKLASNDSVVAVGECGLDYYYDNSPLTQQKAVLRQHFDIAAEHTLPMVFHVRNAQDASMGDAFADFWEQYDTYRLPGVVHSFSATEEILEQILQRDLYVGLNGIITFMKDPHQIQAVKQAPLERIVLETDAPLLTPVPFRGTINVPKHVREIARFLATMRGESEEHIAAVTTQNAQRLFGF